MMDIKQFADSLETETKFPTAYHQFQPGQAPELPYIVYLQTNDDPVFADNQNFIDSRLINVELYTNKKDLASENVLTSFFKAHELPYRSYESYLKDEKMYEVLYQISL